MMEKKIYHIPSCEVYSVPLHLLVSNTSIGIYNEEANDNVGAGVKAFQDDDELDEDITTTGW